MTHYEVFKNATPEQMATLLTCLIASTLEMDDPQALRETHKVLLQMLHEEATLVADLIDLKSE